MTKGAKGRGERKKGVNMNIAFRGLAAGAIVI